MSIPVTDADETLIGMPTVARLLGCTRVTARNYALRKLYETREIEGRVYGILSDVLRFRAERDRACAPRRSA